MTALGRKYEHREQRGTDLARGIAWATPPSVVLWGIFAAVVWQLWVHFPFDVALGVSLAVVGAVWR